MLSDAGAGEGGDPGVAVLMGGGGGFQGLSPS